MRKIQRLIASSICILALTGCIGQEDKELEKINGVSQEEIETIKEELEDIREDIKEGIERDVRAELKEEIEQNIRAELKAEMERDVKAELKEEMKQEVRAELKEELEQDIRAELEEEIKQKKSNLEVSQKDYPILEEDDNRISINKETEVITYNTYYNNRYGFSIDYPQFLTLLPPPGNGDGCAFENKERSVELIVWGYNNTDSSENVIESYNSEVNRLSNILYKFQKDNWYVLSWQEGDIMFYSKVVIGEGSVNRFQISYKAKDEKFFDPIVERLYKSFKTPDIGSAW